MPRVCTVCNHPQRHEIDKELVAGGTNRAIAGQYPPLTRSAVQRHKDEHLPEKLAQAHQAAEVAESDSLLAQVKALQVKAGQLLEMAEQQGDVKTALAGIRESRACVELLAKLLGELDERPQINLVQSSQWFDMRNTIMAALDQYPEAKRKVAAALLAGEDI